MKITTILAALACAAMASAAQAEVVLDQANIPEAGLIPFGNVGSGFSPGQGGLGQSFTAGLDGRFARIDVFVLDSPFSEPAGGLTFVLEDSAGTQLFTTHIDYADVPEFDFFVVGFDQILQIDLSGANVLATAGQSYRMFMTPDAGSDQFGPSWSYMAPDHLTYDGGSAVHRTQYGDFALPAIDYGFRTYVAAVPEPGAWALMILGFGAAGAAVRRRRVRTA
jgi:hypothetical protein